MNKPLILLDVDETLIDVNYKLTCPVSEWRRMLRRAESRGAIIGLNSDTSFEMLQRRAQTYSMHGPIVAERGALVAESSNSKVFVTNVSARAFQRLRQSFLRILTTGPQLARYLTVVGDVNEISNRLPRLARSVFSNEVAVLVNGFRSCSLSFYVRKQVRGVWTKDVQALDEVVEIIDSLGREEFPLLWQAREMDKNPDYGICIFHHQDSRKLLACEPLVKMLGEREIYMVGNSMSDHMNDNRIRHCAVANASEEFKKRSVLVAQQARTQGVIELLNRILS